MRLPVIGPDGRQASLWVDSEGRLLVAANDNPNPLPEGATLAQSILVTDDGKVVVSPE